MRKIIPLTRLELATPGLEVRCAIHCATRVKQNLGSNQGPLGYEPNTLPLRYPAIYSFITKKMLNNNSPQGGSNPRPQAIFLN